MTLGGDGTILWAAKQFKGFYVPNMITFAFVSLTSDIKGSLGYMCMFMIEEHENVFQMLFDQKKRLTSSPCKPCEELPLHVDYRDRLYVNIDGVSENPKLRDMFIGSEL